MEYKAIKNSNIGKQIYKIRKKSGLSQDEFAEILDVTRQTVSKWELGLSSPRADRIELICKEFDVSPEEIYGKETNKNSHSNSDKYEISEFGDVKNIQTGNILKPSINRGGYKFVCISLHLADGNGQRKTIIIHKAVAYTFLNNPNGYICVDHLDCNKLNNHYSNLEWVTMKENNSRAYKNGLFTQPPLESNIIRKLSDEQVYKIRELIEQGNKCVEIAKMFNVDRHTIYNIKNRVSFFYLP